MAAAGAVLRYLRKHGASPVSELKALGLSRVGLFRELASLVEQGAIERVRRGVYGPVRASARRDGWQEMLAPYPQGVLCLLSALAFYQFTTQSPSVVWLALPKGSRPRKLEYPPVRIVYLSGDALTEGIRLEPREGATVRVYSPAKTVADCFKFRNRIGLDVAIEALREGWQKRLFSLEELDAMARVCRVQALMRPYVESLVS